MPKFIRNKMLQIPVIVSLLIVSGSLLAQVITGAISGTVTDATGAAVSGATVTVTNQATNVSTTSTTDSRGFYSAEGLPVGKFTVAISKPGFKESVTHDIQLDPGERRGNNIVLPVGSATTNVTVSANAVQVDTQTSSTGGTIDSKQISNLMLNGRNFQTLGIAIPGVLSFNGADQLPGGNTPNRLIMNGVSVDYSNYTIDGVYDLDGAIGGFTTVTPPVDGIAEFSVLENNYSARYPSAGGGQVVIETKSGTQHYHGSAWDYLRNNAFDANNYFSTTSQTLHQNIYGYTLGGPLILPKIYNGGSGVKKTFFFAANQWYAISQPVVLNAAVFPQAMRNGDFSKSPTLTGNLTLDAHSQALLLSEGKQNCIAGPTTLNPSCFDPVAVALLNAYVPLPNNPSGGFLNYINQGSQPTNQLDYQDRVDHYLSKNNLLTVRFNYEPIKIGYPYDNWGGTPYNTITDSAYRTALNNMVRVQSAITPNLMNTATGSFTNNNVFITTTKGGTMPTGVSIIQSFPNAPTLNRIPNITIAGGWAGNGVYEEPIISKTSDWMGADDLSWVKGNHVLQFGAFYLYGTKQQNTFTDPQGTFDFSGVHTGDPAADYMLGLDDTYSQNNTQNTGTFHAKQIEAYAQDDWRVNSRLVLNLGVRWQHYTPDTVNGNQVTNFNPALYDPTQAPAVNVNGSLQINSQNQPITASGQIANLVNGLEFAGKNGVPIGFYHTPKLNFGPRVGFAYDVFGDGKTSVRGGYGIGYHNLSLDTMYNAWGQNPPYNKSANILNSLLSNGTAGASQAPTTQSLNVLPVHQQDMSQIMSYSLSVEHQLKNNLIATIAYAGSLGRHLYGSLDENFPLPVTTPSTSNCLAPGQGTSSSYDFDPCINTSIASPDYTRPYQGYSSMSYEFYTKGSSNYNSLQSGLIYRAGPSQFSLAYTYGKALSTIPDSASAPYGTRSSGDSPQNSRNFHAEYGPPSFDFTNNFAATWVYSIPYFSHASKPVSFVLGNWSFAGLALHRSGFALSPGLATGRGGLARRPNQVKPVHQIGKLKEWFDTSSFAAPEYGFFGDASNGTIRGPGYTSFNVSLYKTIPITHGLRTEFRAEAFNVLNHPNFESLSTGFGAGNYGHVTSAGDPRIMEFALKVLF